MPSPPAEEESSASEQGAEEFADAPFDILMAKYVAQLPGPGPSALAYPVARNI